MEINSIVVDGVGKFGIRSEVTGLGSGVNILAAGNEAGKSTLFRAVRACLFERHNTKNESVRNLATDGLSLPITVTLGFEHGDQAYTITKTLWDNHADLVATHKASTDMTAENQKAANSSVPFHPGAMKFFAEKGIKLS